MSASIFNLNAVKARLSQSFCSLNPALDICRNIFGCLILLIGIVYPIIREFLGFKHYSTYELTIHFIIALLLGGLVFLVLKQPQSNIAKTTQRSNTDSLLLPLATSLAPLFLGIYFLIEYLAYTRTVDHHITSTILFLFVPGIGVSFLGTISLILASLAALVYLFGRHIEGLMVYLVSVIGCLLIDFSLFSLAGYFFNVPYFYRYAETFSTSLMYLCFGVALVVASLPFKGLFMPLISEKRQAKIMGWTGNILGLGIIMGGVISASRYIPELNMSHVFLEIRTIGYALLVQVLALRSGYYFDHASMAMEAMKKSNLALEESQQALQISEARFRRLFESNIIGILFGDNNGQVEKANDAFLNMLGITREAFEQNGLNWMNLTPPEYHHLDQKVLDELKASGVSHVYEKQLMSQSGLPVDIVFACALLEHSEFYNVCFVLDNTMRKNAERLLEGVLEQERFLRKLVEQINDTEDILFVMDDLARDIGQFLKVDRILIHQFKTVHNEADGKDRLELKILSQYRSYPTVPLIQDIESAAECFKTLNPSSDTQAFFDSNKGEQPFRILNLSGHEYASISPNIKAIFDKYQIKSAIIFDIYNHNTLYGRLCLHQCSYDRKWTSDEIQLLSDIATQIGVGLYQSELYNNERQARQTAEKSSSKKSEFLAMMSHELKTPLNAINGYAQMFLEGINLSLDKQEKYARIIYTSGQHLSDMINDILDISKAEAGKIEIKPQPVDLSLVLDEIQSVLSQMAEARNIHLQIHLAPNLPALEADPIRLRQILYNLLNNAIKFNKKEGSVDIRIFPSADRQAIQVEIQDTGIGIPENRLPEIFTPFTQLDSSYSRRAEGTGLGLSLTKQLIELHGGKITVKSREGIGSTFSFELPIHDGLPWDKIEAETQKIAAFNG